MPASDDVFSLREVAAILYCRATRSRIVASAVKYSEHHNIYVMRVALNFDFKIFPVGPIGNSLVRMISFGRL